jgi:hypothetical protein
MSVIVVTLKTVRAILSQDKWTAKCFIRPAPPASKYHFVAGILWDGLCLRIIFNGDLWYDWCLNCWFSYQRIMLVTNDWTPVMEYHFLTQNSGSKESRRYLKMEVGYLKIEVRYTSNIQTKHIINYWCKKKIFEINTRLSLSLGELRSGNDARTDAVNIAKTFVWTLCKVLLL